MAFLDVFGILFQSEGIDEVTQDMQKLTKEERNAISETKKLEKQQDAIEKKNLQTAKSVLSLVAAYVGYRKILSSVINISTSGEELYLLAKGAGVATESIERLGIALSNYGGSRSSATSTLASLGMQLQGLKFGEGGAIQDVAMKYGINVMGENGFATAEEFLVNIAKRMETLDEMAQIDLGNRLGLDASTIMLLQQGVEGLTKELEKADKLKIFSKEDIEMSRKFQMQMREFYLSIQRVWASLARWLLPALQGFFKILTTVFGYLSEHRGFVLSFLAALAIGLGVVLVKMSGISLAVLAMIAPFIIAGAIIGLFIDDLLTFLEGGESVIGSVAEWFAKIFLFLFELKDSIKDAFKDMWEGIVDAFENIYAPIKAVGEAIVSLFGGIWERVVAGFTGFFGGIWDKIKSLSKYIPFLNGDDTGIEEGRSALSSTQTPLSTMSTNNYDGGSNTNVRVDNITVSTQATDANGIASDIGGAMNNELDMVSYQGAGGRAG